MSLSSSLHSVGKMPVPTSLPLSRPKPSDIPSSSPIVRKYLFQQANQTFYLLYTFLLILLYSLNHRISVQFNPDVLTLCSIPQRISAIAGHKPEGLVSQVVAKK